MADAAASAAAPRRLRDGRLHLPPRSRGDVRTRPRRRAAPSATCSQVRAEYLQDWLVDETAPLAWRLQKEHAGSGALGDIGAHAIDLAQFITGQRLTSVSGHHRHRSSRSVPCSRGQSGSRRHRRHRDPAPSPSTTSPCSPAASSRASSAASRPPASRTGRKNALRIEVSGSRGAIAFDLEDLNALQLLRPHRAGRPAGLHEDPRHRARASVRRAWWPAGHMLGYEHGFVHQAKDFVEAIAAGTQPHPVVRRRPAGAARARRRRASSERATAPGPTSTEPPYRRNASPRRHPMARPITLFTGQWADLPLEEVARARLRMGLRRPRARLLGRPPRPVALGRRRLRRRAARAARALRPQGVGDLEPPQGPGGLRRPDRRSGTATSCRDRSGATATPRACVSVPPRR